MPSVSRKQHLAMQAAAHGKSKLGIPRDVGREFVEHDKRAGKFRATSVHARPAARRLQKR